MRIKNIIDYDYDQEITKDMERLLKQKLVEIFQNDFNEDYFEYLKLVTSKNVKNSLENQRQDIQMVFENKNTDKVDKLIDFFQGDYIKHYEDLVKQKQKKDAAKEDKPSKPEQPPSTQDKSILNRIKPKNDNQAQVLKQANEQTQPVQKKDPAKIRCKNWPTCKNEQCPYAHPKEQCKHFPHCIFGDKCIYIHPQINCNYGLNCKRPNCAYVHPTLMHLMTNDNMK